MEIFSRKREAQQWALEAYRSSVSSLLDFAERRIEWRWDNAPLLALRARRMAWLLQTDPGRVVARRARVRFWKARERKHSARAWAQNAIVAHACGLEC